MIKLKRELIQEIAVNSGFNLKEQPNGEMGLDPYVYVFADAILTKVFNSAINNYFTIYTGYQYDGYPWYSNHIELDLKIPLDILEKIKF